MPQLSIIIPIFNRAHLIEETLNSILAQTFTDWECIIVDDGSTDNTLDVIKTYAKKDYRFKIFKRPQTLPKGANACRNIGLENAIGNYIVFFDSDDLMTENHLEVKYNGIVDTDLDFVITRTKYFNASNDAINKFYKFSLYDISAFNYIAQKINWLTPDVCIRLEVAKQIQFNEGLKSGQEYNYFSKLTLMTVNAVFVNKVVTLHRAHDTSIRSEISTYMDVVKSAYVSTWETYKDVKDYAPLHIKRLFLFRCVHMFYKTKWFDIPEKHKLAIAAKDAYGIAGYFNFYAMFYMRKYLGKGYYFRRKFSVDVQ